MLIKPVFIRELSQTIKIAQAETKKEIAQELSKITSDIPEMHYKSWVLETFVLNVNTIFGDILTASKGDTSKTLKLKDAVYEKVLSLNPALDPDEIYISEVNTLTLTKGQVKLTDCPAWNITEDPTNLMVVDINEYFKFVENARSLDHYIETQEWDLVEGIFINIRKFQKSQKINLVHGYIPNSEDDVKYWVVATCVDNFQQLYKFIETNPALSQVPFHTILYSLFDMCIRHNPFLNLKIKDFKKISKNFTVFKEGVGGTEEIQPEDKRLRKQLSAVPKKEIINLESTVLRQVYGQDDAVKSVCDAIKRAYLGVKDPKTPIGAFFFYGPTSTGKTELAKVLAKTLTRSMSGLVKIPCNTLISSHNVHTLLGAPPGYVGYEEKGLLEKGLENSKFKIILFDEVEKANPKLFDMVLEMLEEGEILMANGTVVNLSQCLIIFTSNIGQQEAIAASNTAGFTPTISFGSEKEKIQANAFLKAMKEKLKPEFLARLNGMFYFKNLTEENLLKSASIKLQHHVKYLAKRKIKLTYPKSLPKFIVDKCKEKAGNKEFHARDVRNMIDMDIMVRLGDFVLNLDLNDKAENIIDIQLSDNEINFSLKPLDKPGSRKKETKTAPIEEKGEVTENESSNIGY